MFEKMNLSHVLLKNTRRLGYKAPTPVQQQSIPPALAGSDVVVTAETGSGKTAAFLLPMFDRLAGQNGKVRALVLCPTREIAVQTSNEAYKLGRGTGLRSVAIYGGAPYGPQDRALRGGTEIIVATPGRLLDHLNRKTVSLKTVSVLVIDEADRMLDMGFMPDIKRILAHLPGKRQTMLFSATMPNEILKLTGELMKDPVRVSVGRIATPPETIKQTVYAASMRDKTGVLMGLLSDQDARSVLVFTRTRHRADRLAQQLARAGFNTARIHGNRSQSQRLAALNGFRSGRYRVLVATDVAARGLDIDRITHVINYDLPATPDDYVHRIGRTARAGASGCAMSLVTAADRNVLQNIERTLGYQIKCETWERDYRANR